LEFFPKPFRGEIERGVNGHVREAGGSDDDGLQRANNFIRYPSDICHS
jgi:hypothetical protein